MNTDKIWRSLGQGLTILTLSAILAACGGSSDADSASSPSASGSGVAGSPTVSGSPPTTVAADNSYIFRPTVAGSTADEPLSFSILNKPDWANFVASSGELSGTPGNADKGVYPNIVISATAGATTAALPPFSIQVTAAGSTSTSSSSSSSSGATTTSSSSSSSSGAGSSAATQSASGTMVPANAKQITDSAWSVWTLSGGVVYQQASTASSASPAGFSANVTLLLYYNGVVFQQNNECSWWSWSGSAWVSTSNPAPAITPACGGTSTVQSVGSGFGIKISGNKFVSTADGSTIIPVGSAVSGLDGSAGNTQQVWAGFPATTVATWQQIKAAWGINTIRVPMNSFDWLNLTCHDAGSGNAGKMYHSNGNGSYTPDPNHVYQGYVEQTIANIIAAGLYVLIDLHTDGPTGAAGPLCPVGEPSFLGSSALTFWTQIATLYKGNPAVMFDLHNEPYGSNVYANWFTTDPVTMRDGGQFANFLMQDNTNNNNLFTVNGGAAVTVVGKQAIVTAIRATGSTNVILDSPMGWAGDIQSWIQYKPTDPAGQIGAAWHIYGYNLGPKPPLAVLAAGYPIMITENEGFDAAIDGGKSSNAYAWAASNDIGCIQWGWNNWGGAPNLDSLISTNPWTEGGAPAP